MLFESYLLLLVEDEDKLEVIDCFLSSCRLIELESKPKLILADGLLVIEPCEEEVTAEEDDVDDDGEMDDADMISVGGGLAERLGDVEEA